MNERQRRLQRLHRLGVKRGARHLPQPAAKPRPTAPPINTELVPLHFLNYEDDLQHAVPIDGVIAGQIIENEHGQYFNFETAYPLAGRHGRLPLADLFSVSPATVATMTGDERWHTLDWSEVLFLDLETTGLELAAGTVAFLIGVGYLAGDNFRVRQVFMRDFNEETALLHDLSALFERYKGVVSFNGKTFDLPLLENRFVMARLFSNIFDAPHFDLLHPARRLWRRRLDNCKLATLETEILAVERSLADIPGYFIPSLYRKYLVDQDARPMAGIFYHNEVDIVSMAALAGALGRHFNLPGQAKPDQSFAAEDILSVGLWQQHLGCLAEAEAALKLAISQNLPDDLLATGQTALAGLLKRQGRHDEAEPLWQALVLGPNPLPALEELAKFYEWQRKDFESALTCIDYALQLAQDSYLRPNWEHRRARVQRKWDKQQTQ